jgi:DNA-binding response OmpR family regulator
MIQRLRRKIDEPNAASLIATRRGEGYMFVGPHDSSSS